MILRITDSSKEFGIGVHRISLKEFANKIYHPMIATTNWEEVYIDVCEQTPSGYIHPLIKKGVKVIPVLVGSGTTVKEFKILTEIFPNDIPKLRDCFLKDKSKLKELILILVEGN